jgi:hypothetical protein
MPYRAAKPYRAANDDRETHMQRALRPRNFFEKILEGMRPSTGVWTGTFGVRHRTFRALDEADWSDEQPA